MKNFVLVSLSMLTAPFYCLGNAYAAGPTRDIVQPAQGLAVAQEVCSKYAGDDTKEASCVLFHSGAIKKVNGQYELNVQLLQPVADTNHTPGRLIKCKAELVNLPDGSIGWKETGDCH